VEELNIEEWNEKYECNDGISSEVVNRLVCSNLEPSAGSHK
jgi:hypothetical protein